MFKIFRRRKDKPSVMYSLFQKFAEIGDRKQRQICDHLNRKAQGLTMRQLKIGLAIFSVLYLGGIAGVMMQVYRPGKKIVKVQSIRVPVNVLPEVEKDSIKILKQNEHEE